MNKIVFTTFSGAVGATLGHAGSPNIGALIIGGAAGTAAVVPSSVLIGRLLSNPSLGKVLVMASKGSQSATSALLRSLYQSSQSGQKKSRKDLPPAHSLQGSRTSYSGLDVSNICQGRMKFPHFAS
jgi:hypothetical protein